MANTLAVVVLGASLGACGGGGGGGGGGGDSANNGFVGDGDETFETAGTITDTVNDSVNGVVINNRATGEDPFDIHAFTAPSAGNYNVLLSWGDAAIDLDLEVYNLAVDNTDPVGESKNVNTDVEQVNDIVLAGGDVVHIRVLAWNSNGVEQSYTLTVQ